MKNLILLLAIFFLVLKLNAQESNYDNHRNHYNFDLAPSDNVYNIVKSKDTLIVIRNLEYWEYPTDSSFYCICKKYYENGNLKEKGILIPPSLKIGIWEYYDDEGKIKKKINEDVNKKVSYQNIINFIGKNPSINKHQFYDVFKKDKSNGWRLIYRNVLIYYNEETREWIIYISDKYFAYKYYINAETGKINALTKDPKIYFFEDGENNGTEYLSLPEGFNIYNFD